MYKYYRMTKKILNFEVIIFLLKQVLSKIKRSFKFQPSFLDHYATLVIDSIVKE